MAKISHDGKYMLVKVPERQTNMKTVLGGRWNKGRKVWQLSATALNVQQLVNWYGTDILEGAPAKIVDLYFEEWGFRVLGKYEDRALMHPHWYELYNFQRDAVLWLTSNIHRGGILALPPGWGKAPTSIVAMDAIHAFKVLIVAPLTLARNWQAELDRWSQFFRSWSRATRSAKDPVTECVITNHEVLFEPHWYDEFGNPVLIEKGYARVEDKHGEMKWIRASPINMKIWLRNGPLVEDKKTGKKVPARKRVVEPRNSYDQDWDLIIVDESVLLKNRKAVKVDVVGELAKYAQQVWLLSGSPTTKTHADLYAQLKVISPRIWRSFWRFAEYFCTIEKNQWGWKITGDSPDHDPETYLRDFIYVPSESAKLELPDYIYDPIEIDLNADQQKAFNEMLDEWVTIIEGKELTAKIKLAQQTRLAQITSNLINVGGKRSSAKEDLLITLLEEEDIELPMIVWCWWVPTAVSVYNRLYDGTDLCVDIVTGDMKGTEKDEAFECYKDGLTDVFVLQMGVGKFGHTLTNTKTIFYHDRHFDSDAYFQSLRRVKRIGLRHHPRVIVPRSLRSFDPAVELNLAGKLESIAKLGHHDLRELLESLGAGMVPWSINEINLEGKDD